MLFVITRTLYGRGRRKVRRMFYAAAGGLWVAVNEAATPKYLWPGAAWCFHQWRTSDIGGVSMPYAFTTACLDRHAGAVQSEKYG